ncbi:bile acid:Na+ symporter, BASS family [Aquiflexum balticum DSM 16537]|uniref:Bile acid:Na+ symporter, BASS family n=1 Tax=Aquiflexum balticum DSM 16537 TaxID=758820 RepID=A0A1W2H9Q8_9BACT|nr:bile acid:Na+ symporter, BASS family [Aquiflexum balticum DSM 16537]
MKPLVFKSLLWSSLPVLLLAGILYLTDHSSFVGPLLILFFVLIGIGFRGFENLKGFTYTIMIFASVTAAMFYPVVFQEVGNYKLSGLIVPLLQIIMFGMGTSMSLKDFQGVVKMPKGVLVGVLCQFSIMPFIGYSLAKSSGFPPEIAAGLILIGCSPSGMASNVMSFLAKANLALSITITAITTMLAPFVTPVLMGWLAGEFVEVDVMKMVMDIVKIVIIPIGAGLLFNKYLGGKVKWLDAAMPLVSMIGIAVIIVIITAAGRDSLLNIGPLLILLVVIHNLSGYTLGYWAGKLFRMDERDCRTIALEVGMQNAGLASGLAKEMGKIATVGLAAAVFGPFMNITGSVLASYWHRKPPKDEIENKTFDHHSG